MQAPAASQTTPADVPAKQPYTAPTIVAWGTLRDMTQAVGAQGSSDGGTKANRRGTR
jgi:hypothetical protein